MLLGYGFGGSLEWAAFYGTAIALLCYLPTPWIERLGPDGVRGFVLRYVLMAALWAGALGLGMLGWEGHHDPAHGIEHLQAALQGFTEGARPWVIVLTPAIGLALGLQLRRGEWPGLKRWGLSALIVGVAFATALYFTPEHPPPKPFIRGLLLAMSLPLAQAMWGTLLLGDALSMGPIPEGEVVDAGPRPRLPWTDRLFVSLQGGGALELLPLLLAGLGASDLGFTLGGLAAFVGLWFLIKIAFAMWASAWFRVLIRRDPERALTYAQARGHGHAEGDARFEQARMEQVLALLHLERLDDAMERVRGVPEVNATNQVMLHNIARVMLQADRPDDALTLLELGEPKGGVITKMWADARAECDAALNG